MQFLPKSSERYTAALREHLQKQIYKDGFNERRAQRLKKITVYGILDENSYKSATEIKRFLTVISACVQARLSDKIGFKISGGGTALIDPRFFCAVICETAKSAYKTVHVRCMPHEVQFRWNGTASTTLLKLARHSKSVLLRLHKSDFYALKIETSPCDTYEKIADMVKKVSSQLSLIKILLS